MTDIGCYTMWVVRDKAGNMIPNLSKTLYVSELKCDGGKDWVYSPKREQAIPMSWHWVRRFESDMRKLNRVGTTFPL